MTGKAYDEDFDDTEDETDKYADLEIDSINAENGNFEIHYHASAYGNDILYLYFEDGKWKADCKEGLITYSE